MLGARMKLERTKCQEVSATRSSMRRDAKGSVCDATVRVRVGKKIHDEVAEGDGPINALDNAL
ncbi:MAG: alpha-isopropylmalate synthase regulatory domain-containing protein, partial [Limnobacter sp.]